MQDYISMYAEGGAAMAPMQAPAPGGAPAPQGGDPAAELEPLAAQYAQTGDPQIAVQIADIVVQMMGVGGGAPAGGDPAAGGAPMGDPMAGGPPMAANGMRLPTFAKGGKAPGGCGCSKMAKGGKAGGCTCGKGAPAGKPKKSAKENFFGKKATK